MRAEPDSYRDGDDRTLSGAIEKVVESSQRVLMTRMELLRIEAEEDLERAFRGAAVFFFGAGALGAAWFALLALFVILFDAHLSLAGSLLLVAGVNATLGIALVTSAVRILARLRVMAPDASHPSHDGDEP